MAAVKKRKRKTRKPESENYEIEISDFELDYHFGINSHGIVTGDFWEGATLILLGKILSPTLKNATKAKISLLASPELDNHWKIPAREKPPLSIGMMQGLKDNFTLELLCWIPADSFRFVALGASSGKVKYASVYGEKLRWRKGRIFNLSLYTQREEE